jgi:hypothetical protein
LIIKRLRAKLLLLWTWAAQTRLHNNFLQLLHQSLQPNIQAATALDGRGHPGRIRLHSFCCQHQQCWILH